MQTNKIEVDRNLKELFQFDDSSFPYITALDNYGLWAEHTLTCHWHDSFEIGIVLSGSVEYIIDSVPVFLKKGDAFFVNMNRLHMAIQHDTEENALIQVFVFKPEVLTGNDAGTVYRKFFLPVIGSDIHGCRISPDTADESVIIDTLKKLSAINYQTPEYELECVALLSKVWQHVFRYISDPQNPSIKTKKMPSGRDNEIRSMLSYIHENYNQKINIDSLMRHSNISRSECFRCFKFFTGKNPVEYINEYRLSKAAHLLRETDMTLTDICFTCGFSGSSYFGKMFKEKYRCSPLQYRHSSHQYFTQPDL